MYLEKITKLIPVPEFPVCTGDSQQYKQVIEQLGIELPQDYFMLISKYGLGIFLDCITIYNPYTDNKYYNLFNAINTERAIYNDSKAFFEFDKNNQHPKIVEFNKKQMKLSGASGVGYPFNFYPEKNGLIPCGTWDSAYMFYWNTASNPWSIIVYGEDEFYFEYDMCITEFLFKLFTNDISIGGDILEQKPCFECF